MNLTDEQLKVVNSNSKNTLIIACAGSGKLLHKDTLLLTINGYVKAEDIKKGNIVFDMEGKQCKVIGIHKNIPKSVYKLTFSDKSQKICGGEHLWFYSTVEQRKEAELNKLNGVPYQEWHVDTTENISKIPTHFKRLRNLYMPVTQPLQFEHVDPPVDPWVLGFYLCGGNWSNNTTSISISSLDNDLIDRLVNYFEDKGNGCYLKLDKRKNKSNIKIFSLNIYKCNFTDYIKDVGLRFSRSFNKFVPDLFKYNSEDVRLKILQGLFDSDGTVYNKKNEFTTTSKQLSEDVKFLAESLGMTVTYVVRKNVYYLYKGEKKKGRDAYILRIKCNEKYPYCFSSNKHRSKYKDPRLFARKTILKIEKIKNKKEPMYCFEVDSPTHSYLLEGCLPTHNTTTLISYVEKQIEKGVDPRRILFCTFTRKAAGELKERIKNKLIEINIQNIHMNSLWVGTIHSVCNRILRRYASLLGYTSNFTIVDSPKQLKIAKFICNNNSTWAGKEREFVRKVSTYKNFGPTDEYNKNLFLVKNESFLELFDLYNKRLKKDDSMDYDDLLINAYRLLDKIGVLTDIQNMFDIVMIDEFQDINWVQYEFFKKISSKPEIKFVGVGDDDQCIYEFRGSNVKYILKFDKDNLNTNIYYLSENFRCPINVVNFAEQIIKNTNGRKNKSLNSNIQSKYPISLDLCYNEYDEAKNVVDRIKRLNREELKSTAILYRTQRQSRLIEEYLVKESIPYKIVGGMPFYHRKEVKDILALIRVLMGDRHKDHILRIINCPPRGIGDKTQEKMEKIDLPLWDVLSMYIHESNMFTPKVKKSVQEFVSLVNRYSIINMKDIEEIKRKVEGYCNAVDYINKEFSGESLDSLLQRRGNIDELLKALEKFLEESASYDLESFYDHVIEVEDNVESNNVVSLMTIHACKGLEFKNVFVVGVQTGLIPHTQSIIEGELDSERRLFYVAVTRTKEKLFLSSFDKNSFDYELPPTMFFDSFDWKKYLVCNKKTYNSY